LSSAPLTGAVLSPIWPAKAALGLAIAMVSGWGLTVAGTPFSANSLLLAKLTGYNARVAATRWNLHLSLTFIAGADYWRQFLRWFCSLDICQPNSQMRP